MDDGILKQAGQQDGREGTQRSEKEYNIESVYVQTKSYVKK